MSICIMCIKGSIHKESKAMEVTGLREMSAPLIGTQGNCSPVCQVGDVNYGCPRGKSWGRCRTLHTSGTAEM